MGDAVTVDNVQFTSKVKGTNGIQQPFAQSPLSTHLVSLAYGTALTLHSEWGIIGCIYNVHHISVEFTLSSW